MTDFENAVCVMKERFGRDYQFALSTCVDNIPSSRFVDTYFDGESFYIVTYRLSRKAAEIAAKSDLMVIVGGRSSSNTKKLVSVCESVCRTVHIRNAAELPKNEFKNNTLNNNNSLTCIFNNFYCYKTTRTT